MMDRLGAKRVIVEGFDGRAMAFEDPKLIGVTVLVDGAPDDGGDAKLWIHQSMIGSTGSRIVTRLSTDCEPEEDRWDPPSMNEWDVVQLIREHGDGKGFAQAIVARFGHDSVDEMLMAWPDIPDDYEDGECWP